MSRFNLPFLRSKTAKLSVLAACAMPTLAMAADGASSGDVVSGAIDKLSTLGVSLASLGAVAVSIYLVFVSIGSIKRAMAKIA